MTIPTEITRLATAKANLATAIAAKGVTVPATAKLDAYPALVEAIESGGCAWAEYHAYVPSGSDSYLTSDGKNYMARRA